MGRRVVIRVFLVIVTAAPAFGARLAACVCPLRCCAEDGPPTICTCDEPACRCPQETPTAPPVVSVSDANPPAAADVAVPPLAVKPVVRAAIDSALQTGEARRTPGCAPLLI